MSIEFDFAARLKRLSEKIFSGDVEGILISKPENIFYLSGFRGDSTILFVTKNFRKLITDGRYTEQAEQQAKNFEIIKQNDGLFKKVAEEVKNPARKKFVLKVRQRLSTNINTCAKICRRSSCNPAKSILSGKSKTRKKFH